MKQGEQPPYGIECVNPWAPCLYPPTSERGTTFTSHPSRSGIPPAACKDDRAGGMPAAAGADITSGDASGSSSPEVACNRNPKQHISLGVSAFACLSMCLG